MQADNISGNLNEQTSNNNQDDSEILRASGDETAVLEDKQAIDIDENSIDENSGKKVKKGKNRKKWSVKKKAVVITSVVLAVCVALAAAGYAMMYWQPFKKTTVATPAEIQTPVEVKADCYKILVCGIDFEEGTARGHLTDVQMYVNINAKEDTISILQIPRDTFIGLDEGVWTGKINGIYGRSETDDRKNGIIGLAEYINKAYKLPVDYYATVTMTTFKDIIDEIGGVEMDVPFTIEQDGVVVPEGKQVLTGAQAEALVRKRKSEGTGSEYYDGSDTKRMKMQRKFMAALIKKFKNLSLTEVYAAIKTALPDVDSDLNIGNIKDIVNVIYDMPMKNMCVDMMPGEDYVYPENGQWVYSLHKQEVADLLNERYRTYTQEVSADELEFEELVNTESYLDNTVDTMDDLLDKDVTPGTDKSVSSGESSAQSE